MSVPIYLISIALIPLTIIIIVCIKYVSAAVGARARATAEDAYRALAEKAVAVESGNVTALSAMQTELAQVNTRLAALEKLLKEV
jgi:hypothetical protein